MSYPHYATDCGDHHGLVVDFGGPRPEIVVLCGSTRFVDHFNQWRKDLTEAGVIVLSIEVVTTQARDQDPQHANPALKSALDELHKRKIDLADRVMVLNVDGYVGQSTRSEIDYATALGKPIDYLVPVAVASR
jgi:multidrug resistance efflux pump